MRAPPLATTLTALALAATGCSFIRSPSLEVVGVEVTEETPDGVTLSFLIDATNPNDEPLPLQKAEYNLALEGKTVFRGSRFPFATLRRNGTQRIVLPAVIPAKDLPTTGEIRYRFGGSLRYITPGEISEILFDYNIRRPKITFAERGVLDFGSPAEPDQEPQVTATPDS